MAQQYPSLPEVEVLLGEREGEREDAVLTDGGCSGNDGLPVNQDFSAARSSNETNQDGAREDGETLADKVQGEYRRMVDEPPYSVRTTFWQGKVRTETLPLFESRVMYEPLLRRAVVYFPNGWAAMVGESAWVTARVRAEQAKMAGEDVHRFPAPLLPAIETVLRREGRKGRHLHPDEWKAMFMLFSDESQRLWAQFHCDDCGFVRRVASRATEDIMQMEASGRITCRAVGISCYTTETTELLPWNGGGRETGGAIHKGHR